MKETEIVRACLDYLAARKIWAWRQNNTPVPIPGGGFRRFVGLRGIADILAIVPPHGTLCAIEVKRENGRTSEDQEAFGDRLTALGGIYCVVHSVDELEADLREANVIS